MRITSKRWLTLYLLSLFSYPLLAQTLHGPLLDPKPTGTRFDKLKDAFSQGSLPKKLHPFWLIGRCYKENEPDEPKPSLLALHKRSEKTKFILHVPNKRWDYFDQLDQKKLKHIYRELEQDWEKVSTIQTGSRGVISTALEAPFFAQWELRQWKTHWVLEAVTPSKTPFMMCYFFKKVI